MKRSLKGLLGVAAAAIALAPMSASAQIPDPLPSESITDIAVGAAPEFSTLVTALQAAGLADTFDDCAAGPFTVFAPTNAAFEALPAGVLDAALADPEGLLTRILQYHVVPGILDATQVVAADSLTTLLGATVAVDGTTLNGSTNITAPDLAFGCNGVIHQIDQVLIPPSITDLAVATPELSTLVTALGAAGLDTVLDDCTADGVTVFAPTNAAFEALPAGTLEAALADPTGLLTTVLTYHVVPGVLDAEAVTAATSLTTLQGEAITVSGTTLNGSIGIAATDIFGCNGVVHLIDGVLLPPSLTEPAPTTTAPPTTAAPQPTVPGDGLPATGNETTVLAIVAAVLLLGGIALMGVRRRSA